MTKKKKNKNKKYLMNPKGLMNIVTRAFGKNPNQNNEIERNNSKL